MSNQPSTVLVTGSEGLLGRPTCERLSNEGYKVVGIDQPSALDDTEKEGQQTGSTKIACDVTDERSVEEAVGEILKDADGTLASVVHLAAYYDFSGEDSPLYQEVTVRGTDHLLSALQKGSVEQFLFSSTMLIHKPVEVGNFIDEETALSAKWPYPQSKIETERLIRQEYPEIRSVFLRLAGVYTEWGTQPTLVHQIKRIYEQDFRAHFFPGNMQAGQSSVYLDDAVDAIVRTVNHRRELEAATPILVGESLPPSYEELQEYIGRAIHHENWSTVYVPPLFAKVGATAMDKMSDGETFIKPFMVELANDHYALDISRAERLIGWQPQHVLLHVLPNIIRNLLDDPAEWYARNGLDQPD